MLISRSLTVLKTVLTLKRNNFQHVRKSSTHKWRYRTTDPLPSRMQNIIATAVQGILYYWMLWHLFTEPGHVFGEFPYPNPRKWTNEELGIPENDANEE